MIHGIGTAALQPIVYNNIYHTLLLTYNTYRYLITLYIRLYFFFEIKNIQVQYD